MMKILQCEVPAMHTCLVYIIIRGYILINLESFLHYAVAQFRDSTMTVLTLYLAFLINTNCKYD